MSAGHLLFTLFTIGYLLAGMRLAERDLAHRYGAEYERYRSNVSAFLPPVVSRRNHPQADLKAA